MRALHERSAAAAAEYGQPGNYVLGANISGFVQVAMPCSPRESSDGGPT